MHKKRTAEQVCIEYAIAVEAVREQTRIMRDNRCPNESANFTEHGMNVDGESSCLDDLFEIMKEGAEEDSDYEEMCPACKIRFHALQKRRAARKRLGAAKRAVESIGKRENK
jgi:hypothetical protein